MDNDLPQRFAGRILDVDRFVALAWGDLMGEARAAGMALSPMDCFIAATARSRSLTLATRNTRDFVWTGIALIDPWAD